jgi:hypothetical protein
MIGSTIFPSRLISTPCARASAATSSSSFESFGSIRLACFAASSARRSPALRAMASQSLNADQALAVFPSPA